MINLKKIDPILFFSIIALYAISLITILPTDLSFSPLFIKHFVVICIAILILLIVPKINFQFLKNSYIPFILYILSFLTLLYLLFLGDSVNNAKSWILIGSLSVQPVDFIKIILIIILARYFCNRHIYIKNIKHIFITGILMGILFLPVFLQPDLGSSIILASIWFFMIFVSGISRKHLIGIIVAFLLLCGASWQFLGDYQKERVLNFITPDENIKTTGYNVYQSKIAIGSGLLLGKGVLAGTQSKSGILPLSKSDFIFASFAEEWGFLGSLLLFSLFIIIGLRLMYLAINTKNNFDVLFIVGTLVLLFTHFLLHIGSNTGSLPVTGMTLPFVSVGGTHIIAEAILIGLIINFSNRKII